MENYARRGGHYNVKEHEKRIKAKDIVISIISMVKGVYGRQRASNFIIIFFLYIIVYAFPRLNHRHFYRIVIFEPR